MKIKSMGFFFTDALKSLKRNKTLTLASAATVAAALFILGIFILAGVNVNEVIKNVESKVEVEIFLKDGINSSEKSDIESIIKNNSNVASWTYIDKAAALDKYKALVGEANQSLLEGFDKQNNPLPTSYVVKMKKPEMVSAFVSSVNSLPGIDSIGDRKDIVDTIITVTNAIKWVGIIVFAILGCVGLFLIGNTIKITVYSRRREIGIMKFIGATDWFIRWPFVIEGVIIGLSGALISVALLYFAYRVVVLNVGTYFIQLIPPSYVLVNLLWEFVIGGILIGALGSITAIRKFLAV
jgi:cell division transport system permease protein